MTDKVVGKNSTLVSNAERNTDAGGDNAGILDAKDFEQALADQVDGVPPEALPETPAKPA